MFLRQHQRTKDGKRHTSFALVESQRTERGLRQRIVAQLGKLTADQQRRWQRTVIFHARHDQGRELSLFPEEALDVVPLRWGDRSVVSNPAGPRAPIPRRPTALDPTIP